MYTQCPECGIAFRVTADVLKQAAGMVRCGGCGDAFNALAFLSESMPEQASASKTLESVPELKPEIIETDSKPPRTISAEQSAALLKTLDELAGSDIRIEDTGVEWRVLDEDAAAEPAADDDFAGAIEPIDAGAVHIDETLDASETPVDQFLTKTPEIVESPEIFEEEANAPGQSSVDELRFDDNTPLPDDFDLDDESSYTPASTEAADVEDEPDAIEPAPIHAQAEIALSDPDEWTDILGEFQDLADDVAADVDEDAETSEVETLDEVEAGDNEDSGEEPLDVDTQFALQAEAMGIDLSGMHETEGLAEELEQELDEESVAAQVADEDDDAHEDALVEEDVDSVADEVDESDDVPEAELDESDDVPEAELELARDDSDTGDVQDEEPLTFPMSFEDELNAELDAVQEDALDEELAADVDSHSIEDELEMLEDGGDDGGPDGVEHVVPPMTEEEHTVNMQIDQDLMALAVQDEDGFASTMVIPEDGVDINAPDENRKAEFEMPDEDAPGFETIIMEGEFVRNALGNEKREADIAAAAALAELAAVDEVQKSSQSGGMRWGMVGGVVLLVLLLGMQMIHQSREALATIPAFSSSVGQIYRAIGQPIQPAWDITAWRIEASDDTIAAEEGTENLTIYSRIGNTSDRAMPYPLISISLTDRYLEPVGSQILDPVNYLPTDLDPRRHVEPGNTFNAIMTIESPSIDATGYKLDVCYRLSDGRLRCAIEDFK